MKQKFIQYGVGIDVSKKDLAVCFLAKTEEEALKIRSSRKFANTPAGILELMKWVEKYRKEKCLRLRIYLEVTGVYHEQVLFHLHEAGYEVSLLMGKRVKAYGKSLGEESKNDQKDSYVLGHMALSRQERLWQPASKHIVQIRSLTRHRRSLVQSRVAYQNQLHAVTYSARPSAVVKESLEQLISQMNLQIAQIEQEALSLAQVDEDLYKKICLITKSLKGLGIITMLEVISETNGFSEFKSINQLIKYAGYDIIENQSGNRAGKTRISKHGNARLRAAMYMPVLSILSRKVEPFYALYLRVLKRNPGIKKKAMVALQRKLLIIIYTLWKKNEAFDPEYQWGKDSKTENNSTKKSSSDSKPELHGIAQPELASNTKIEKIEKISNFSCK